MWSIDTPLCHQCPICPVSQYCMHSIGILSAILCVTCALSALCIAQYYGAKYWNTLCRLSALCHSISIWSIEKCSTVTVLHSVMCFLVLIDDLVAVLYPVPQTSRMYLVCYCIPNSVPFRTDTGKGRSRQGCTF